MLHMPWSDGNEKVTTLFIFLQLPGLNLIFSDTIIGKAVENFEVNVDALTILYCTNFIG